MHKIHDYAALEREFMTGDTSIRELVRRHGFRNASVVHVQTKARDWYVKREAFRRQTQAKTMERLTDVAARRAERELEVSLQSSEVNVQPLAWLAEFTQRRARSASVEISGGAADADVSPAQHRGQA